MNQSNIHQEYSRSRNNFSRRRLHAGVDGTESVMEQRSLHNIDRYCLVWFDTEISLDRNIRMQAHLRSILNDLFVFKDLGHLEGKVQKLKEQKIFFIFNGSADKHLINRIHRRAQVAAIYVYCKRPHWDEHLRPIFPKLKSITNDFGSLWKNLKNDVHAYEKVDNARIISSITQTSNEFSEYQDNLIRLWASYYNREPSYEEKELLLKTLSEYFYTNESMHNVLKEFKDTIGPTTAINWYTRESLISRLVNHAFRTSDWNLIEKLRYFIGCLYMQLTLEHSLFVKRYHENPFITLYRGQLMNRLDFDRLIKFSSRILFLTSFISASFQEHVAMNFINACEPSYNEMRLLFKIIINTDLKGTQLYADITHLSTYVHEEEVLIMSGATFIVTDILLNTQRKVPIVLMELCPNQQEYDFKGDNGDSFQVTPELFDPAENRVANPQDNRLPPHKTQL
ncbi:unnamed protein product [Rotaria socialis]|uniref:NAD(P)(+)--arginine ADP-ribosyltransferase n=1 Tax=Rotaria socialis TaxID=392032 RepID=A0A820RJC0_9BILA|nr:unnamed protein product [Rotaria socialis]CAF4440044.1 unnamed protein product [Rotaria socialis]CAF4440151.1 unnamed protein product [Rotaria socialis]CAF4660227.1 unnamed protein product [Rotaria socialis]